jgi:hypothetical protein
LKNGEFHNAANDVAERMFLGTDYRSKQS